MLVMDALQPAGDMLRIETMVRLRRRNSVIAPPTREGLPGSSAQVAADIVPAPQLWPAFVFGWLPVLGFVAWLLVQEQLEPPRLPLALLALAALAGLYLRLTLRGIPTGAELTAVGSRPGVVVRRLLLLLAMAALIVTLVLLVPDSEMWWLAMYAIVAAGLTLPTRVAAGVVAGLVGLAIVSSWLVTDQFDVLLLLLVAFGAGAIAIRQLTIAVAQLRAAREELARLAVAEERVRFARDLHDLLGHSLSMIVLKSELAGRLLPSAPERAEAEVGDIERSAREALRQVRAAVAGYRQPGLSGELAAACELLTAAGIAATVDDQAGPLPPTLDGLLAWTVREGVTNVVHHSRARHCEIRISRRDNMVRAQVTDDGRGTEGGPPVGGSGLTGLAERATAHGGRLEIGPLPGGGFGLQLEVPVSVEEAS